MKKLPGPRARRQGARGKRVRPRFNVGDLVDLKLRLKARDPHAKWEML